MRNLSVSFRTAIDGGNYRWQNGYDVWNGTAALPDNKE